MTVCSIIKVHYLREGKYLFKPTYFDYTQIICLVNSHYDCTQIMLGYSLVQGTNGFYQGIQEITGVWV